MAILRLSRLRTTTTLSTLFLLFLSTISLPANAQSAFTFIEYNAAFALGLSLPLIIIAFIIRERIVNSWWYLIMLSTALLTVLYALTTASPALNPKIYSAVAVFLFLASNLPKSSSVKKDAKIGYVRWCNYSSLFLILAFLINTWFLHFISDHTLWAIFSTCLILISFLRFSSVYNNERQNNFRYTFLWLMLIAFCISVFLQQHWLLPQYSMVILAVSCYVICLTNFAWRLSFRIKKSVKQEVEDEFSPQIEELKSLSRDAITNLPTQAHALKRLHQQIDKKSSFQYAVVVFKPINFHKVNHLLGHKNSDLLLLQLAYCLQQNIESNSALVNFNSASHPVRIARLPSLQFMVVLDISQYKDASQSYIEALCRELTQAVPDAVSFKSFSLNFELIYGIDIINPQSHDIAAAVAWAGDALLTAEKNQQSLCFYNHQSNQYTDHNLLKMEQLKQAIEQQDLIWQYQPQINLITKEIIGFESRVVWPHNGGIITDDEFITIAENSGEVFHLVRLMIDNACQVAVDNLAIGISKPITINFFSIASFEETLIDYIELQLTKHQLPKSTLIIEIPEATLGNQNRNNSMVIDHIKNAGLKIAIDKFSGSYQSLRYLRKISIQQLKVDCAALSLHEDRQTEKAIINALVNLATVMHIPIVGFNINSISALEIFQEIDGVNAQGSVISPTIDASQLPHWISAWQAQNPHKN
ncbi:MAG: EAL domain-containing protein [Thalassotalea sp.]